MDYEKKYKEAIEKVRSLHDNADEVSKLIDLKEELEAIFPEIKESEDERMKKSFTRLVKAFYDVNFPTPEGFTREDMIAWLEKQCEQKPANWFQELEDKLANATPKQLAEWKEKYFKEEPAEWSEEDELRMNTVCELLDGLDLQQNWLKSLKDRVVLQPKQEWSEEDRKMMRNIIDDIHCGTNFNSKVMHAANEREKWFKSICMRYQSKWKPSDEQMEALKEQCVNLKSTHSGSILCELYSELIKL